MRSTLRPSSVATYHCMARHLEPIASIRLQALRPAHLNALHAKLEADGLAPASIRLVHAVIHRALRDAMQWGLLPRSPAAVATPPTTPGKRATAWTPTELRRFLEHVADDRLYPLWRLAATTGMRRGELAGLTWRAVDLEGGRLTVEQQLSKAGFGPPKSRRSLRTIALDPGTVDALRKHRDMQELERQFAGEGYVDRDLVFADELGAPINPERLSSAFSRHRKAAGIPTGTLHTLRHTAATLALTSGVPVHIVAARRRPARADPQDLRPTCCRNQTNSPPSAWQPCSRPNRSEHDDRKLAVLT